MRNLLSFVGIAFAVVCCMVLGAGEVFANPATTGTAITFTPLVDFSGLWESVTSMLGGIVAAVIGIGVAMTLAYAGYRALKRVGR